MPGVLHRAVDALRVRHGDGGAAVGAGQCGNPVHRPIGIGGVRLRHLAAVGDVLKGDQPLLEAALQVVRALELRLPLAVRHGHRQARAGHACQQH